MICSQISLKYVQNSIDCIDQNSFPTTYLLILARSKRLETASQRKNQTKPMANQKQVPCHSNEFLTELVQSIGILYCYFLSHDSQTIHQDVLYYVPTNLKVMRQQLHML